MRTRFLALCALTLLTACFDMGPKTFANLAELKAYQLEEGFVEIAHFGDAWPAEVKSEKIYHDKVSIVLTNQEMHTFDEFEGYKLKVVKLQGARNADVVVAFRSEEKE